MFWDRVAFAYDIFANIITKKAEYTMINGRVPCCVALIKK